MLDELIRERRRKLDILREQGIDPYPAVVRRTHKVGETLAKFSVLSRGRKRVSVTGRVMAARRQGAIMFLDLRDESGQIQLVASDSSLKDFKLLRDTLDIGDFIEASGTLFKTKRGERSIQVGAARIIAKSLRPLPDKWHGLENVEERFRRRYLDLLMRPELRELFVAKSRFWNEVRAALVAADFLEVETPVLETVPGGAEAEPFVTHHNALDADFYLRISLELNLKRLMVAGFERVFEIGRIFRNEGISVEHLQDYTQMEMYWAYQDYEGLMRFIEKLAKRAIKESLGTLVTNYREHRIQWGKPWARLDYYELFKKGTGLNLALASESDLRERARSLRIEEANEDIAGKGRLIDMLFKKTVRPTLIQPSFLINTPVDIEPLAKRMPDDPGRVQRFQIVACGTELGKGFSELNDPIDQRVRFEEQMKLREAGDREAQMFDEDYVEAMEYGMPPMAGFGFSERLFAILKDMPVREAVLFPLMRPRK